MHLKSKAIKELRVSVTRVSLKYRASVLESETTPPLGSWINQKARISADSTVTPCVGSVSVPLRLVNIITVLFLGLYLK